MIYQQKYMNELLKRFNEEPKEIDTPIVTVTNLDRNEIGPYMEKNLYKE